MARHKQSIASTALVFVLTTAGLSICALLLPPAAQILPTVRSLAPLRIIAHEPVTHEVGVALTAPISASFDGDVDTSTVTSRTLAVHGHLGGLASGTFHYDEGSRTLTLDPDRTFHAGEVLRVSATSGVSSTEGAPLKPYGWQFTAGPVFERSFGGFADLGAALIDVDWGFVAWGDYDNDGDLDILLTGYGAGPSRVYRNDEASGFTDIGAGLMGVDNGSVSWGDYDNDGDLDILITGEWECKLYRNNGDTATPAFTEVGAGLEELEPYRSSAAFGDYDNDGDLDILLTGDYSGTPVYRNNGDGTFTDSGVRLTPVKFGSVDWGDYDNDGDLDILLAGTLGGRPVSKVYRNNSDTATPTFTDIGAGLTEVGFGSVAWGDYDGDAYLDILLAGRDSARAPVAKVYRNSGDAATPEFIDIGADLTGVYRSSVAWGDYDNDGDLDILLTGRDSAASPVSKVYCNDGDADSPAFTDIGAGLVGVRRGGVAWGDYDNDGDLDILLTGSSDSGPVSKVYRNNSVPSLGNVTPPSGSGPVGVTTHFTTTWKDADGWEDLDKCFFLISPGATVVDSVFLLYNAKRDKLWIRSDDGSAWLGGFAPGSDDVLENSQAKVYCKRARMRARGDTLGVRWAIEFKSGYVGTKKIGLGCRDVHNAWAKRQWKGAWTIATPPTATPTATQSPTATNTATPTSTATATQTPTPAASGAIGDYVWFDESGDGIQDAGEGGLSGVVITLTNSVGLEVTTTTDANGYYIFEDLSLGLTYTATVSPLPGYVLTTPGVHRTTLTIARQTDHTLDFGFTSALDISKFRPHGDVVATYTFWYYIYVTNNSDLSLADVVITDALSEGIAFYSVRVSEGGTFDAASGTVTWVLEALEPKSSTYVWISARTYSSAAGRYLENVAVASSLEAPPVSAEDVAWVHAAPPTPTSTPTTTQTPTPTATLTPTATQTPPDDLYVTGLVYDAAAGPAQPVSGAPVSVLMCVPRSFHTGSGADGRYNLLLPGSYLNQCSEVTLQAWAAGYQSYAQVIPVADLRAQPDRDIALQPAATPTPTGIPPAAGYYLYAPILKGNAP
jgi:uncharacterized repeat protein (TIGR01451 family)